MILQRRRLCPDGSKECDRRQLAGQRVERTLPVHAAARGPYVPAGDSLQLIDLALPGTHVKCRLDMPFQLRLRVAECAQRRNGTELTRPHVAAGTWENLADRENNRDAHEIGSDIRGSKDRRRDVGTAKLFESGHARGMAIWVQGVQWVQWVPFSGFNGFFGVRQVHGFLGSNEPIEPIEQDLLNLLNPLNPLNLSGSKDEAPASPQSRS